MPMHLFRSRVEVMILWSLPLVESIQSAKRYVSPWMDHQLQLVLNAAVAPWAMSAMSAPRVYFASILGVLERVLAVDFLVCSEAKSWFSCLEWLEWKGKSKGLVRRTMWTLFVLG